MGELSLPYSSYVGLLIQVSWGAGRLSRLRPFDLGFTAPLQYGCDLLYGLVIRNKLEEEKKKLPLDDRSNFKSIQDTKHIQTH